MARTNLYRDDRAYNGLAFYNLCAFGVPLPSSPVRQARTRTSARSEKSLQQDSAFKEVNRRTPPGLFIFKRPSSTAWCPTWLDRINSSIFFREPESCFFFFKDLRRRLPKELRYIVFGFLVGDHVCRYSTMRDAWFAKASRSPFDRSLCPYLDDAYVPPRIQTEIARIFYQQSTFIFEDGWQLTPSPFLAPLPHAVPLSLLPIQLLRKVHYYLYPKIGDVVWPPERAKLDLQAPPWRLAHLTAGTHITIDFRLPYMELYPPSLELHRMCLKQGFLPHLCEFYFPLFTLLKSKNLNLRVLINGVQDKDMQLQDIPLCKNAWTSHFRYLDGCLKERIKDREYRAKYKNVVQQLGHMVPWNPPSALCPDNTALEGEQSLGFQGLRCRDHYGVHEITLQYLECRRCFPSLPLRHDLEFERHSSNTASPSK